MLDRLRTIREVHAEPGHHLRIAYDDGTVITVDLDQIIRQGGVFVPLADERFSVKVAVGPRGRSIRWPGDIDFCADALWLQAQTHDRRHAG
jgi:hypothetical protein